MQILDKSPLTSYFEYPALFSVSGLDWTDLVNRCPYSIEALVALQTRT